MTQIVEILVRGKGPFILNSPFPFAAGSPYHSPNTSIDKLLPEGQRIWFDVTWLTCNKKQFTFYVMACRDMDTVSAFRAPSFGEPPVTDGFLSQQHRLVIFFALVALINGRFACDLRRHETQTTSLLWHDFLFYIMPEYSSFPRTANPSLNKTVSVQDKTVWILTCSKSRTLGTQLALCGVMLWLGTGRFSHLSGIMLVLGQYYYKASEGYEPDEYGQLNHAKNHSNDECCGRSKYQEQVQIITSHTICGCNYLYLPLYLPCLHLAQHSWNNIATNIHKNY